MVTGGIVVEIDLSRIYSPVSNHKEMRTRLGWTISYKSMYFVPPSLELVPLLTGMRERSIETEEGTKAAKFYILSIIALTFRCF